MEVIVVVTEDGDREFKQFGGVALIAQHRRDGLGPHRRVGHECIREELDRDAGGDAPQDAPFAAVHAGGVVDELTMLQLPLRIRRDECKFVKSLPRPLNCANGGFQFFVFSF